MYIHLKIIIKIKKEKKLKSVVCHHVDFVKEHYNVIQFKKNRIFYVTHDSCFFRAYSHFPYLFLLCFIYPCLIFETLISYNKNNFRA